MVGFILEKLRTPVRIETWLHQETNITITFKIKGNRIVGVQTETSGPFYSPGYLTDLSAEEDALSPRTLTPTKTTLNLISLFYTNRNAFKKIE